MSETEYARDDCGWYTQVWLCPPPAMGDRYRVTDDVWSEDNSVRTISAWASLSRPDTSA